MMKKNRTTRSIQRATKTLTIRSSIKPTTRVVSFTTFPKMSKIELAPLLTMVCQGLDRRGLHPPTFSTHHQTFIKGNHRRNLLSLMAMSASSVNRMTMIARTCTGTKRCSLYASRTDYSRRTDYSKNVSSSINSRI